MTAPEININVAPRSGRPQRVVIAKAGEIEHRDNIDTNSTVSLERFIAKLADKLGIAREELSGLDDRIIKEADAADEMVEVVAQQFGESDEEKKSQSEMLVDIAIAAGLELWHTPEREAFATVPIQNHFENWKLRSGDFRDWLTRKFYDENKRPPCNQPLKDAIAVLGAKAKIDGEEHKVYLRVAEYDGAIYLDLCNAERSTVKIDANGWSIVANTPVRFRRVKAMLSLPTPVTGGNVNQLRRFINVSNAFWPLVLAWLMAALRPRGPYPLLCLHGEQGSAKSTTARLFRRLVDPNSASLRSEPKEARDLMIAANNGWLLNFDNLSFLPPWLSDAICRLSTGGGFSTRKLYEDDEEMIFNAMRPVILNGIEQVASRSDLIDRSIQVRLLEIPEDRRQTEQDLWRDFAHEEPFILGALLDAVSAGLRNLATVKLDCKPRMADFATWAVATETALGFEQGTFIDSYAVNHGDANDLALESSSVGTLLLDILEKDGKWAGTAGELKTKLELEFYYSSRPPKDWPNSPKGMAGCLRRLAPNLRKAGWDVLEGRDNTRKRNRTWNITRRVEESTVQTVRRIQNPSQPADDRRAVADDSQAEKPLDRTIADGADDCSPTDSADHTRSTNRCDEF